MKTHSPRLPYPSSSTIYVYEDRAEMKGLRPWQFPTEAHVVTYTLPTDKYGFVKMTDDDWVAFSDALTRKHPGCVFSYVEE